MQLFAFKQKKNYICNYKLNNNKKNNIIIWVRINFKLFMYYYYLDEWVRWVKINEIEISILFLSYDNVIIWIFINKVFSIIV